MGKTDTQLQVPFSRKQAQVPQQEQQEQQQVPQQVLFFLPPAQVQQQELQEQQQVPFFLPPAQAQQQELQDEHLGQVWMSKSQEILGAGVSASSADKRSTGAVPKSGATLSAAFTSEPRTSSRPQTPPGASSSKSDAAGDTSFPPSATCDVPVDTAASLAMEAGQLERKKEELRRKTREELERKQEELDAALSLLLAEGEVAARCEKLKGRNAELRERLEALEQEIEQSRTEELEQQRILKEIKRNPEYRDAVSTGNFCHDIMWLSLVSGVLNLWIARPKGGLQTFGS